MSASTNVKHLRRRELLQGLAALAASGWIPQTLAQAASTALSPVRFSTLCTAATGYAFQDPKVASAMLRALTASIGGDALSRIANLASTTPPAQLDAALAASGLTQAAERVVASLYSGIVDTPKGPVVISYDQALVWQACAWTKPNAWCGGATNYWADAPTSGT